METYMPPFPQGGYGRRSRRSAGARRLKRRRTRGRRRRQRGRGVMSNIKGKVKSKMGRMAINAACKAAKAYAEN